MWVSMIGPEYMKLALFILDQELGHSAIRLRFAHYPKYLGQVGRTAVIGALRAQRKIMRIMRRGRMDTQHRRDWHRWIPAALRSSRLFCRSYCVADRPEPGSLVQ